MKNCPICGGECKIMRYEYYGKHDTFGVFCTNCGLYSRSDFTKISDAEKYWNDRVGCYNLVTTFEKNGQKS